MRFLEMDKVVDHMDHMTLDSGTSNPNSRTLMLFHPQRFSHLASLPSISRYHSQLSRDPRR